MAETHDSGTPTYSLTIYLSRGDRLDGGPFEDCTVYDTGISGEVILSDDGLDDAIDETALWETTAADIADALADEMREGEPIQISGSPVDQWTGTPAVSLPIVPGYLVELNGIGYYETGDLIRTEEDRGDRCNARRSLRYDGGSIYSE